MKPAATATDVALPAELRTAGAPSASSERSFLRRHGVTQLDVWMSVAVLLLTCAYTPFFFTWSWAPRYVLVTLAMAPGLVALGQLAARRDRAASIALGIIGWAFVSALTSGSAASSLVGFIGQDTSVVAWAGALGLWALARSISDRGRRLLTGVVVAALCLNGLVAVVQMMAQIDGVDLGLLYRRSIGLTINPVFLGAFMAGAIALVAHAPSHGGRAIFLEVRPWFGRGSAFLASIALAFSGSRVALASAVVVLAGLGLRKKLTSIAVPMAAAAGFGVGTVLSPILGGNGAADRLASGGSGGRVALWETGWRAFLDRPITGWGLGRFRTGAQEHFTFSDVAALPDPGQLPFDAHNLFVNVLVTLGLPGFALVSWFIVVAIRSSAGPLAAAGGAIAVTWSLQPAALMTLPFTLILLGAAWNRAGERVTPSRDRGTRWVWTVAITASVIAAGWVAVAEVRMESAARAGDSEALYQAVSMYPHDPIALDAVVQSLRIDAIFGDETDDEVDALIDETIEREPTRPRWWTQSALWNGSRGDLDAAEADARRALELQPTSPAAWTILRQIASDRDDATLAQESEEALCRLGLSDDEC